MTRFEIQVLWVMGISGLVCAILIPQYPQLWGGILLSTVICTYSWKKGSAERNAALTPHKANVMSRDIWSIAYTNADEVKGGVLNLGLQCFPRPHEWADLAVYPDHPEYEKFCKLPPAFMLDFSFHPNKVEGLTRDELSSYLTILRASPPGAYLPEKKKEHPSEVH